MVKVDEAFEVHYKKEKVDFQVLVDFEKLEEFRKNPSNISVYDVLADYKIYKNLNRGELVSEKLLKIVFKGMDEEEILKIILLKGDAQIPSSYLNIKKEEKKEKIINYIKENARNPVTKTPFTYSMLESEINKLKFNFDLKKDFKKEAEEIIEILKKSFPITIEKVIFNVEIPPQYIGKFVGTLRKLGTIKKEFYDESGNWKVHIEINEGKKEDFIDYLKKNSNGEAGYSITKI